MKPFGKDPRVVVLDDITEFALCRDFKNGVLCPYDPLTDEESANTLEFAKGLVQDRDMFDADDSSDPLYPDTWEEIIGEYPESLDRLKETLLIAYNDVSGSDATTTSLRINSTDPSWKHAHSAWAVSYSLSGQGTDGFDAEGNRYATPPKHVFAIPPDFEHAAPAALEAGEVRVTLALSRPEI